MNDSDSDTDPEIAAILGGKNGPHQSDIFHTHCQGDSQPPQWGSKIRGSPLGSNNSSENVVPQVTHNGQLSFREVNGNYNGSNKFESQDLCNDNESGQVNDLGVTSANGISENQKQITACKSTSSTEVNVSRSPEVNYSRSPKVNDSRSPEVNYSRSPKVNDSRSPEVNSSMSFSSDSSFQESKDTAKPGLPPLDVRSMTFQERSVSFNSSSMTPNSSSKSLCDFDRSLSISLEELMENIKVPQSGQRDPAGAVDGVQNDPGLGTLWEKGPSCDRANNGVKKLNHTLENEDPIVVCAIDEQCNDKVETESESPPQNCHSSTFMGENRTDTDESLENGRGSERTRPDLGLKLNLDTENTEFSTNCQQTNNSCRTPEYCRELSSLSLGFTGSNDLEPEAQGQIEMEERACAEPKPTNSNVQVKLSRPRCAKEIPHDVLYSGLVVFPGYHDNSRRPVLFVDTGATEWQRLGKLAIVRLMLYYISNSPFITLLVNLTDKKAWPLIKDSILLLQWNRPGVISRIIFISESSAFHPEEDLLKAQCSVIPNFNDLQEYIDPENLPETWHGRRHYNHGQWIRQRLELESYVLLCETLQHNFTTNTVSMTTAAMPTTLQGTAEMLNLHRSTMTELLDDMKVRDLHDMGHRFLLQLKKEENDSYADQIHTSYETVCSSIQRYVQVADERLLALERHLLVKQFEESCNRILSWASDRRSELSRKFGEVADSLNELKTQRLEFDRFYLEVVKQYAQCDCLLTEANQLSSSGFLGQVNAQAQNAAEQISKVVEEMEMKKEEVETASQLYMFVDKAYSWALTGMKFVASLQMSEELTIDAYQDQIDKYDEYMRSHPPIPNEQFQQMREVAARYNNVKCQRQCETAQRKCSETKELFKKRRKLLVKARDHHLAEIRKIKNESSSSKSSNDNNSDKVSDGIETISTVESPTEEPAVENNSRPVLRRNSDVSHTFRPQGGSNNNNNGGIPSVEGPNESAATPVSSVAPTKHRPKKMLRKSQSMTSHSIRLKIGSPMRNHEPDTHGRSKWSLAIEELILTEVDYVKSLDYVIEHYYPLMNQLDDVPQALRGKRGVIFGNIENIRDFHAGQFVEALRGCQDDPARVAEVFIQHRESFAMYALYSKNKPRSDDLMTEHGKKFFNAKQLQLRDKMDLASYLLKPVQRMGKYALLLHNIGKHSDVRYRSLLKEAESLVKFQLRHGNDLLAMDSIINCDVNLKEQGELKRQDEFFVFHGRRKFLRHIFLFDDLILLSKPQRVHGGHDLYHYKSSYKTSEIGLTENIGETGLKFEIWFRRPMQDNIVIHAASEQKKAHWVEDVRSILWRQALKNRENRRTEMVSMGVGSKPHLDIRSSKSPITDRSVAAERLMRVLPSRTRASIAVASFDHSCKRPHSTVSTSSTSSNGSLQQIPSQPASMFDFRAIVEGEEYESGSGGTSSLCTSNGDIDPLEGDEMTSEGHPQQYVTTV